jgi:hypothetical protein
VISVAMDAADPAGTARHEAVHFLREVGAIDAGAWRALEKRAQQWRKDFKIDERYGDLSPAEKHRGGHRRGLRRVGQGQAAEAGGARRARGVWAHQADPGRCARCDAQAVRPARHGRGCVRGPGGGRFAEKGGAPGGVRSKDMLPAWHGSPHDFEAFDSGKIGTGEGAQAYGHGLYFASKKEVAEYYKDVLSNRAQRIVTLKDGTSSDEDTFAQRLQSGFGAKTTFGAKRILNDFAGGLSREDAKKSSPGAWESIVDAVYDRVHTIADPPKGKLYQVELAPDDDQLLDWDKPLSEQSAVVREKLKAAASSAFIRLWSEQIFEKRVGFNGG